MSTMPWRVFGSCPQNAKVSKMEVYILFPGNWTFRRSNLETFSDLEGDF